MVQTTGLRKSEKGGLFDPLVEATEGRPWLWAVYILSVVIPITLIIMCLCCGGSSKTGLISYSIKLYFLNNLVQMMLGSRKRLTNQLQMIHTILLMSQKKRKKNNLTKEMKNLPNLKTRFAFFDFIFFHFLGLTFYNQDAAEEDKNDENEVGDGDN